MVPFPTQRFSGASVATFDCRDELSDSHLLPDSGLFAQSILKGRRLAVWCRAGVGELREPCGPCHKYATPQLSKISFLSCDRLYVRFQNCYLRSDRKSCKKVNFCSDSVLIWAWHPSSLKRGHLSTSAAQAWRRDGGFLWSWNRRCARLAVGPSPGTSPGHLCSIPESVLRNHPHPLP